MPTVMALFQIPEQVEQAISELSLNGFTQKDVAVVLFDAVPPARPGKKGLWGWLMRGGFLGDSIDRADGVSVMDGISVGAVIFGFLGLVYGNRWRPGPITLGTAGMLGGGLLGYIVDRLIPEKRRDQYELAKVPGLMLVEVTSLQADRAEEARQLLEANHASQVAVLSGAAGR